MRNFLNFCDEILRSIGRIVTTPIEFVRTVYSVQSQLGNLYEENTRLNNIINAMTFDDPLVHLSLGEIMKRLEKLEESFKDMGEEDMTNFNQLWEDFREIQDELTDLRAEILKPKKQQRNTRGQPKRHK
jgi:predicted  nucleic acid-binding Zn-ribbon protein